MYQTVIILLVTMVTTIVTTIVTVRFTMTGRVVSQTTKERLTSRAKKYGTAAFILLFCSGNLFMLIYNIRKPEPITRVDVYLIAFYTITVFLWIVSAALLLLHYLFNRKSR